MNKVLRMECKLKYVVEENVFNYVTENINFI